MSIQISNQINNKSNNYHNTEIRVLWYKDSNQLYYKKHYNEDEKLHGLSETWYPNGQLKSRYMYDNDIHIGNENSWWPDGKPRHEIIRNEINGIKYRLDQYWYFNGNLKYRENSKNNVLHGEYIYLCKCGQILDRRYYNNGVFDGIREMWENHYGIYDSDNDDDECEEECDKNSINILELRESYNNGELHGLEEKYSYGILFTTRYYLYGDEVTYDKYKEYIKLVEKEIRSTIYLDEVNIVSIISSMCI